MISPRKILALKLRSLGDTVLMTAPLMELKKAYPDAELHVLILKNWAPLIESDPGIKKVWHYTWKKQRLLRGIENLRIGRILRRENFDLVVNFHASPSSAMLCLLTGAKKRAIHFHGLKDKNRFSTVTIPGKGVLKPVIERDMDTIRALGLNITAGVLPKIFLSESIKNKTQNQLRLKELPFPRLMIGLGSSRQTKSWPVDRFAEISARWVIETGGSVLAVTSNNEVFIADQFLTFTKDFIKKTSASSFAKLKNKIHALSYLSVIELAAVLQEATVFLGNDSGPRHLAVAVSTPTVTIFGPEDPFEWHPYPNVTHPFFYIPNLSCRNNTHKTEYNPAGTNTAWCGLSTCENDGHACMTIINTDEVFNKCKDLINHMLKSKTSAGEPVTFSELKT